MHSTDRPSPHPQVVLQEDLADWTILFHPLTGEAVGLGPVGVVIWKLLAQRGHHTLAEIAAQVQAQCEDAPSTILEDVLAFANDLERRLFVLTEPERRGDAGPERHGDTETPPLSASPRPPLTPSPRPRVLPSPCLPITLALADGTRLALCAGDEEAARVVGFFARAASLTPTPLPVGEGHGVRARRLLIVSGLGQNDILPYATQADVVCVLEPSDAPPPKRRRAGLIAETLTPEQWLWRQLLRLSACIACETQPRGGVLLHSGLAEHQPLLTPCAPSPPPAGEGRGMGGGEVRHPAGRPLRRGQVHRQPPPASTLARPGRRSRAGRAR